MAEVCDIIDEGVVAYTYTIEQVGVRTGSIASAVTTVMQHLGMSVAVAATAAVAVIDVVATPVTVSAIATTEIVEDAHLIDLVESRAVGQGFTRDLRYDLAVSVAEAAIGVAQAVAQVVGAAATASAGLEIDFSPVNTITAAATAIAATRQELFTLVVSEAYGSGMATGVQFAVDIVAETVEALAEAIPHLSAANLVESGASVATATEASVSAVQLVVSEAFAEVAAQDTMGGEAWTASSDTWAMSRYDGTDFESIASIGDRLYAANETGLYVMSKTPTGAVQARVDLGISELSKSKLVRLVDAYMTYATTGRMTLLAADHGEGDETLYPYEFPRNRWPEIAPDNTALGKGHRARFFRFVVKNQAGSDFLLSELRILFDETSRRY